MFEITDQERCRAICTLLSLAGIGDVWNADGPTDEAIALRSEAGDSLEPRQKIVLSAAWALWDGSSSIRLACLWRVDRPLSDALASLIRATGEGPQALETWIMHHSAATRSGIHRIAHPALESSAAG